MNVVFSEGPDQNMIRIAEIDGKFYPYSFSLRTGQVTRGNAFGKHDEFGIKYVSKPYDTLEEAKKTFIKYQ